MEIWKLCFKKHAADLAEHGRHMSSLVPHCLSIDLNKQLAVTLRSCQDSTFNLLQLGHHVFESRPPTCFEYFVQHALPSPHIHTHTCVLKAKSPDAGADAMFYKLECQGATVIGLHRSLA